MITEADAQTILNLSHEQLFPVKSVAQAAGVAPTTIQGWINRRHLELMHTRLYGQGNKALFAYYDVIQIIIMAELSRLGIDPKQSGSLVVFIHSFVTHRIMMYARIWGDPEHPNAINDKRYATIYYNHTLKELEVTPFPPSMITGDLTTRDVVVAFIDCQMLAEKCVHLILKMK